MAHSHAEIPVADARPASLAGSVERLSPLMEWASVKVGQPPADSTHPWRSYTELTRGDVVHELVQQRLAAPDYAGTDEHIIGNYLFRDALFAPLAFMGYLWTREHRVPSFAANGFVQDHEWLQHWLWPEPAAVVLPGDPLAGAANADTAGSAAELDDALFDEIHRFCTPILGAFRANRYVATANAWGAILDAVAFGVQLAGRVCPELGQDASWARWGEAIAARSLPVRRRPRRLEFEWAPGQRAEMLVRAGCCLWFMTPGAKQDGCQDYCTTCYLKDDEQRIARMVAWKRKQVGDADAH